MPRTQLFLIAASLCSALYLTGCGASTIATTTADLGTQSLQGQVHGGQQGIAGATIQLYTAGTAGNGSPATPMLTRPVQTDPTGSFSISNGYTCGHDSTGAAIPSSTDQVYMVASGGNPGLSSGATNPALVLVTALGSCSKLTSSTFIYINEVTTVAAAWALAPFTTSASSLGATATNAQGIENAFLDAALLADTTKGITATLPANLTVETGKINALADALASCVNSDGTTACNPLFNAATDTSNPILLSTGTPHPNVAVSTSNRPSDTFTAALNIVKHPGQNVAAVFNTIGSYVPFPTTLTQSPNDWTMTLTVTGGGLSSPTAMAIDSQSNLWVANQDGPLSAFNPQGHPLSDTGFGGTNGSTISQVNGLAIDPSDNIWVTNYNGYRGSGRGSVTKFYGASSGQIGVSPQPTGYTDSSIQYPYVLAADTNGDIYIANTGNASATIYNSSGGLVAGDVGASFGLPTVPQGIALDATHGFWLPGDNQVAHISAPSTAFPNGQLLSNTTCCQFSYGVATDALGNLWVADYLGGAPNDQGAFANLAADGTLLLSSVTTGGINHPARVAVDAAQNVWFSNLRGASITEVAGNGTTLPPGTALSPSTGVYGTGGFGLDAALDAPFSIAPDRSGNLWVSNESVFALTMFFGLATPTVTPLQPTPTAP